VSTPAASIDSPRRHPYLVTKDGQAGGPSFFRTATSSALVRIGSASTATAGASVLLLADEDGASTTALANSIAQAGFLVTVRPAPEYTWDGTNPSLEGYDLVIHLNGNTFFAGQTLSSAAQSALVEFVRGGGGFIGSQWSSVEIESGQAGIRDLVLSGYNGPFEENCPSCAITYTVVDGQQSHPVLAGLPSDFTFEADGHASGDLVEFASDPSTVLMTVMSGLPGVMVRNFGSGKVVNFSFAPNYSLAGEGMTLRDGNVQQLYINAVRWAAGTSSEAPSKLPATITLVDSRPTYNGSVQGVSIVTNPAGLAGLNVSYSQNGFPVSAPVNAGTYQVLVTLDNPDYEAPQATGTLTITRAVPVIQWTPPTVTAGIPLGTTELNASALGVDNVALSGEYVYLPGIGTALQVGTQPLSVEFLPFSGNYTSAIKTVLVAVANPNSSLTFRGFYLPVRNLPFRNRVVSGRTVPVKFSVTGTQSATALAALPTSTSVTCVAGVPEIAVAPSSEVGTVSTLQHDRRRGEYRYDWKTSSTWAGSCRKLVVTLIDGSVHEALFRFAKELKPTVKRGRKPQVHRADDKTKKQQDDKTKKQQKEQGKQKGKSK
jgi:hypothetical protein